MRWLAVAWYGSMKRKLEGPLNGRIGELESRTVIRRMSIRQMNNYAMFLCSSPSWGSFCMSLSQMHQFGFNCDTSLESTNATLTQKCKKHEKCKSFTCTDPTTERNASLCLNSEWHVQRLCANPPGMASCYRADCKGFGRRTKRMAAAKRTSLLRGSWERARA